jgi:hypothetical protein
MKGTHKNALEILSKGGAVPSGEWKTGTGRFVSKRPIPEGCIEVKVEEIQNRLFGMSRDYAKNLLALRPKTKKLIVVNDHRLLEKLQGVAA